jgi:PPE-repeat protein
MSMVDFGALPPEINSGRMYAGAGSGPLAAAAVAWQGLASELGSAATSYRAVISDLTAGAWVGPSSLAMAAAATPYAAWMTTTASQAEQTASQLTSAIVAYETAFAATVPPPIIAANRALLAELVATNIVGQNTPAIAATEAQYAEMWARDAGAMYGYAGASAAATTVTPFNPPPPTTNPAGAGTQAAALTQAAATPAGAAQNVLSQVPAALQSLGSGSNLGFATALTNANQGIANALDGSAWITNFETISTALAGYSGTIGAVGVFAAGTSFNIIPFAASGIAALVTHAGAIPAGAAAAAAAAPAAAATAGSVGPGGAGVSAGLGGAATVGSLSVPQSWATASPAFRLAATALPAAGLDGVPEVGAAGFGGFGGMPPILGAVNAPRNGAAGPRAESRFKAIPELAREGRVAGATPGRGVNAPRGTAPLSEREELNGLRQTAAELARERDVLMRSAARLLKEASS